MRHRGSFLRVTRAASTALAALVAGCASSASMPRSTADFQCASDFEFWLGEWNIRQRILKPDGSWFELPAMTTVSREGGGCAITEHWSGDVQFFWEGMAAPESIWGYSTRVQDPTTGLWSIYWMDSRAPRFDAPYVGAFLGERGEFFRTIEAPNGPRVGRIVFSRARAGIVDWELAVAPAREGTWTTLWTMEMTRR